MQKNYKKHFAGLRMHPGVERFSAIFQANEGLRGNGFNGYGIVSEELLLNDHVIADHEADLQERPRYLKLVHSKTGDLPQPEPLIWKRIFDVMFSLLLMVLGLPVFAAIYLVTKISSPGPVFYKQERLGKNERKFQIYKFRSMYVDAEKFGPQLSNENDPRITKWGRLIRRTRLDELPQFWNVLKGDMSVVGPRPERSHFVDKIVAIKPDYKRLQEIKPGITSMGQVHYGYAENVDQMCVRMEYDLQYLRQVNLRADIGVIFKTVKVMVQCRGK